MNRAATHPAIMNLIKEATKAIGVVRAVFLYLCKASILNRQDLLVWQ
jgi:hypothetical protein